MSRKSLALLAAGLLLVVAAGIAQDRGLILQAQQVETPPASDASGPQTPNARPAPKVVVDRLSYSEFLARVEDGRIAAVKLAPGTVQAETPIDGTLYTAAVPHGAASYEHLTAADAEVTAVNPETGGGDGSWLYWIPIVALGGFVIYRLRQRAQGGAAQTAKAGKSTAKLLTEDSRKAFFKDVAGCDESKQELEEVVDFLQNPDRYTSVGGQIPRGVLLSGPPGTGKTLLARAVAGEAGVPFFSASGSGFTEMYVGVGASRVRDMFQEAKKQAPCIVFIDEVDTVGRKRNANVAGSNEEREQTLNQLLAEMDGFETNEGVILIAATNMPEALDPALTRPGRFDRHVTVPNPDVRGREAILEVHADKVPLSGDICLRRIARATPGFSGADLANIVNEAALFAARENVRQVCARHFERAGDKVRMGAERRGLAINEHDRKLIAYHEAGHAIVGLFVPGNDPLHKVTIIPRGQAMGFAMWIPDGDRWGHSIEELTGRIAMAFGGRVAEEGVFGRAKVTSGAQGDIRHASQMARRMVLEWGMSEKVGPIDYAPDPQTGRLPDMSPQVRAEVDNEIRRILSEGETTARDALAAHQEAFHRLAEALLEYETLEGEEIDRVVAGQPPYRPAADRPQPRLGVPAGAGGELPDVPPVAAG